MQLSETINDLGHVRGLHIPRLSIFSRLHQVRAPARALPLWVFHWAGLILHCNMHGYILVK